MAEKILKSRIVHKHDIEANWLLATNFTPKKGELIVYDPDESYTYSRIKIGDGVTNVNELPFHNPEAITFAEIDEICGAEPFAYDEEGNVSVLSAFKNSALSYDADGNVTIA